MVDSKRTSLVQLIFACLGLVLAALSGLSEHVGWLQAFCSSLSGSCSEAARFSLLRLPLWGWGLAYYAVLILTRIGAGRLFFWLVAAGVGFEVALVALIVSLHLWCLFCLLNAFVMLVLLLASVQRQRLWPMLSVGLLALLLAIVAIPYENGLLCRAAPQVEDKTVVARIGDQTITESELDAPLQRRLYDLSMQIYKLREERLKQMIPEAVLEREAKARNVTLDQLVNGTILSEAPQVSEEEIDRYAQENAERLKGWPGSQEELRARIREFLLQQKKVQKVLEYAKGLEPKYGVAVTLKEPAMPLVRVPLEGSPSLGPADAPVVVVEFSDYQCPACRQSHPIVKQLRQVFQGKIRWVFKDYPLQKHKDAERAAEAAQCANDQNKFWEYQDVLYSKDALDDEHMVQYATELGMNADQFRKCLESGQHKATVEKEVAEAKRVGVDGTPTFIINGQLVTGSASFEAMNAQIESALQAAKPAQ